MNDKDIDANSKTAENSDIKITAKPIMVFLSNFLYVASDKNAQEKNMKHKRGKQAVNPHIVA